MNGAFGPATRQALMYAAGLRQRGAMGVRWRRTVSFGPVAAFLLLSLTCAAVTSAGASLGGLSGVVSTNLASRASGQWIIDPVSASGGSPELDGVSCTSASSCVAVGVSYATPGSTVSTDAAETWNGTTWVATPAPPVPATATSSQLLGISCVSATFCIAVGSYERGRASTVELSERWNGTSWSRLPISPPSEVRISQLRSVSCASSTSCTAVGDGYKKLATAVSIGEHFNGAQWSAQSIPFPAGATYVQLKGVSCPSSTVCVAVGTVGTRSPSSEGSSR